jgi:hypothetical protein
LNKTDVDYLLLADGSEGEVNTLLIRIGEVAIMIMGETENFGEGLLIQRAHIQVDPPSARILTRRTMSVIADRTLEDTGYAEIIIRGAARTTGARQGHTPRELRFARGADPEA